MKHQLLLSLIISSAGFFAMASDQVKCTVSKITYNPTRMTEIASGLVGGTDKIIVTSDQKAKIVPLSYQTDDFVTIYLANLSPSGLVSITTSNRLATLADKTVTLIDYNNDIVLNCSRLK